MPFPPGTSGNPRGRPKSDFTLAAIAKKHTHEALQVLVDVMRTPDHPQRVLAADKLLDRGWGRAPMVLAGQGGVGPSEIVIRLETPMPPIDINPLPSPAHVIELPQEQA